MLSMQAVPLLPVTAGLLCPSLPPVPWQWSAVRIVADLRLALRSGSHRDPASPACPCPQSTRCSAPFWPASYLLSAYINFFTPMQFIQNILIWHWSRFLFCDKGLRVLSTPMLWRDCWLYTNIVSYLASLKQAQMSLKGYDLCALRALEIHFKRRLDPRDA